MDWPDVSFDIDVVEETLDESLEPSREGTHVYECDSCCFTTYNKDTFEEHQQSHNRGVMTTSTPNKCESALVCDQCGKHFRSRFGLQLHSKNKHLKVYNFTCHHCGKGYNQRVQFRFHLATHVNLSLKECSFCRKAFQGHSSLERHLIICLLNPSRSPDDSTEFVCDIYSRNYVTKDRLAYHKKGMHGPKRYLCSKCGKAYSWRASLRRHSQRCK